MGGRARAVLAWTLAGGLTAHAAHAQGITAVSGITVGHHTLKERPTGCTVVIAAGDGAVGGVAQRGGAPGTRETNLLDPLNLVDRVNAVVLSGGSAFGLDAATGVMRWLEEQGAGFRTPAGRVPIVPAAVIFDLGLGNPRVRPDAECGYRAAAAASGSAPAEGSVGAGAGATVGKLAGVMVGKGYGAMKGGVGSAAIVLPNGLAVGALAVVNALGDVIDPGTGRVIAGVRAPDGSLADARTLLRSGALVGSAPPGQNTTIAVVATNARLSKAAANRLALMADDGLARAIAPSHTSADGDTVFALATGRWNGAVDLSVLGGLAAEVMADAIVRAVTVATGAPDYPAVRDLRR